MSRPESAIVGSTFFNVIPKPLYFADLKPPKNTAGATDKAAILAEFPRMATLPASLTFYRT